MFNGLGHFLGSIFRPVENAVAAPIHATSQALGNLYNNVTHPHPQAQAPQPQPMTNQANNPLSAGRVWGNAVTRNVAQQQQYTPKFLATVLNTRPNVGSLSNQSQMAAADYNPANNQIELRSDHLGPYTLTHEGLHAAYQHETPQQRQAFLQLAQKGLGSNARNVIGQQLASSLYGNSQGVADVTRLPFQYATEVHSMAPQVDTFSPNSAALQKYYKQYFGDDNFYRSQITASKIKADTSPKHVGQFNDWRDEN